MRRQFAAAGRPMTIVNAAVDGQSSYGHIAVFDRWFPTIDGLKAKYVLAYVGINDVGLHVGNKYDDMRSPELSRRIADYVRNKSAIYELYRTLRGMMIAREAKLIHGGNPPPGDGWTDWRAVSDPVAAEGELIAMVVGYRERLRRLAKRIRNFGAEPIFVTQPSSEFRVTDGRVWVPTRDGRPHPVGYTNLAPFNQATMEICAEVHAICIDLAAGLDFEPGDFYDRVHNTPVGTKKIGQYLFEALRDRI